MENKTYKSPRIEIIVLDSEISLALESNPPIGPEEVLNNIENPFKHETDVA